MIHEANKQLKRAWSARFNTLPLEARLALRGALQDLRKHGLARAQYCWKKHKAPMAVYWKVVGVYAGHLARSIKVDD